MTQVPWKVKSFIFYLIDFFDAQGVLYFLQKNITKRSSKKNVRISKNWINHEDILKKYNANNYVFEFGAGKSLAQNLFLSKSIKKQLVVDLNQMLDIDLVNKTRSFLSNNYNLPSDTEIKSKDDLKKYGIEYIAPFDASETGLDDGTFDACISTDTLEHIPLKSLEKIFSELYRVVKNDGIISAIIDYTDHYAHTDKSLSQLNFLKYSNEEWSRFNHDCHYQNRLRHFDYIEIFDSCGFEIVSQEIKYNECNISEELAIKFHGVDSSWSATSAHFVLRKK